MYCQKIRFHKYDSAYWRVHLHTAGCILGRQQLPVERLPGYWVSSRRIYHRGHLYCFSVLDQRGADNTFDFEGPHDTYHDGRPILLWCNYAGINVLRPAVLPARIQIFGHILWVGLLPMMLGICIGNRLAAIITSKLGVSLHNATAGAALEILFIGLMTRWNASTSTAEAIIELVFLGIGMGAVMSALLLTSQAAVEPELVGIVTGFMTFAQGVGHMFGIAIFSAAYINRLISGLLKIGLSSAQIGQVLVDVQNVQNNFHPSQRAPIVNAYADSLQNGWWAMFACACALGLCCLASKQHKFRG